MLRDHTQTHHTHCRSPVDEWSARRRDVNLATHNTHKRQTSMTLGGFEPAIPASERPQTHALNRVATGTASLLTVTCFCLQTACNTFWLLKVISEDSCFWPSIVLSAHDIQHSPKSHPKINSGKLITIGLLPWKLIVGTCGLLPISRPLRALEKTIWLKYYNICWYRMGIVQWRIPKKGLSWSALFQIRV